MEFICLVPNDNGVSSIVPPRDPGAHVIVGGENVYKLSFSLVTPAGGDSYYYDIDHLMHCTKSSNSYHCAPRTTSIGDPLFLLLLHLLSL